MTPRSTSRTLMGAGNRGSRRTRIDSASTPPAGSGAIATNRPHGRPTAPGSRSSASWSGDRPLSDEIFLMRPDGSGMTRVTGDAGEPSRCTTPVWSPDGSRLAVSCRGGVYSMNPQGGDVRKLAGPGYYGAEWSPDGSELGLGMNRHLYLVNADGSGLTTATHAWLCARVGRPALAAFRLTRTGGAERSGPSHPVTFGSQSNCQTGRTSIVPQFAPGMREAISIACSGLSAWTL